MGRCLLLVVLAALAPAAPYEDRFVWVFGWGLGKDEDAGEISRVLESGAKHGINGAVMSFGLDTLCKKPPEFFRRLDEVKKACEANRIEFIPSVFSVGYGGAALSHDRNLAEGLPVEDVPFAVKGGEGRLVPDESARLVNGGFEEFKGDKLQGVGFHDQPGEISFRDAQVKGWLELGRRTPKLRGFMYTPWQKKYALLPAFGDLLRDAK